MTERTPPAHQPTAHDDERVAIVVLNWNSGDLGARAVESALAQDWPDVAVIVVDNASTDSSMQTILAQHGDVVTAIHNDENLGFARGMNSGIATTDAAFVVPLNCDATLDPGYVSTLVSVLRGHPRAAVAGGLVRSDRVGRSGPLQITSTMRTRALPVDAPIACDKVNGACPMFRRAALPDGPYDPTYAMYGEDVDLAFTLRRSGWEYRFEPTAGAAHVRSFASAPKLADRRGPLRVSTLTNRHRNIVRHSPRWVRIDLLAFAQDFAFAVRGAVTGDPGAITDVIASWRAHARWFGQDRARRRTLPPLRSSTLVMTGETTPA